jgi:ribosomal protein L40E
MRVMSCSHRYLRDAPDINWKKNGHIIPSLKRKITSFTIAFTFFNIMILLSFVQFSPVLGEGIEYRVEPIIISGSDISSFIGKPVDEIWVFSYVGGNWEQIPFQIDEKNNINGSYFFNAEDGLLDVNDEMVFMPEDCGFLAPENNRVLGVDPLRFRINVKDPIDQSERYAYIYTSSNLVKTFTKDYVDYNTPSYKIEANDYIIGYNETHMGVIDELKVDTTAGGDGTDLLDRFKYRFQKTVEIKSVQYNEDNFTSIQVGIKDGPIRVISQLSHEKTTGDFTYFVNDTYFAYGSYLNLVQEMSTNSTTDWVEITVDLLSTQSPINYYDSNSNELIIDGTPDILGATETPIWFEISSTAGTVISVGNFSQFGATSSLMYTDDSSSVDVPESDVGEYGNFGISAINPPQTSTIYFSHYFTSNDQENIGSTYLNYTNNPMVISILPQEIDPSPPPEISNIILEPDPQELNGIVRISADIEDNLDEIDSVYVRIIDPENNEVGNYSMERGSSSNEYYYEVSFDMKGTYDFVIWASDNNGNINSQSGQFDFVDTTSPEISKISLAPAQIGIGDSMNISVSISDLGGTAGAWINIQDPNGGAAGNMSMTLNPVNERFFYVQSFETVGIYSFTIWTNDSSDNWNSSHGQFEILDNVKPQANAGFDQEGNPGVIIEFDASGSSDNVEIVNYTWTFLDEEQISLYGLNPTYRFLNADNIEVVLKVEDLKGNFDSDTMYVNITEIITLGSISGIVTNSDGNPIAGAKVKIENTSSETTTDGNGNYLIYDIPAGIYEITITRDGYKAQTLNNVVVVARQTTSDVVVTMAKEQTTSEKEDGGFLWLFLVVVIVGILLVVYLLARPKKETEIVEEVIEELHFLCPECGALVNYDMKSCPGCGVEFGDGEVQEEVEVEEPVKESPADIYMCPSCGSFVSSQATQCEKCGYDFEEDDTPTEKEDIEAPNLPAGFVGGSSEDSQDEDDDQENTQNKASIPSDIKAKMTKEVEKLISENGFEMEEVEMELEVELGGEGEGGEDSIGAKEILELFKEELKDDDTFEDSKSDYHAMSKEIDDILDDKKEKNVKKSTEKDEND